jgi:hypothetical protein
MTFRNHTHFVLEPSKVICHSHLLCFIKTRNWLSKNYKLHYWLVITRLLHGNPHCLWLHHHWWRRRCVWLLHNWGLLVWPLPVKVLVVLQGRLKLILLLIEYALLLRRCMEVRRLGSHYAVLSEWMLASALLLRRHKSRFIHAAVHIMEKVTWRRLVRINMLFLLLQWII